MVELYNYCQYLIGLLADLSNIVYEILTFEVLNMTIAEIMFGSGFAIYLAYVLVKFVIPT